MIKAERAQKNAEAARRLQERIAKELERGAGKGVEAAVRFLAARVKEAVSVPAPKKAIRGTPLPGKRLGPILGYRATEPAVKGAPPRVVSGKLRQGVASVMIAPGRWLVGTNAHSLPSKKYPGGFNYPKHLELTDHPFLVPTARKWRKELRTIVGKTARVELGK